MITQKKFVGKDAAVKLSCPECHDVKNVPVSALKNRFDFKAKCPCGTIFRVQLEFRKRFRKQTEFPGYYEKVTPETLWGNTRWETISHDAAIINCRVGNLSSHGLGLHIADADHPIVKDDLLKVVFILDNSAGTVIEKKSVVRSVAGDYIGCEFTDEEKDDTKIGFYLL